MPFVDDQGTKLWYDVQGDGPPLVLTGGFGLLHNQFDKVRALLTPEFKVIDWNYRGCGQADRAWPGGYTLDTWVDDLVRILDHLKIERTALWATSTGSRLAIRFAARFPGRATRIMVYPTFQMARSGGNAGNRDLFADVGETYGYEAMGRMFQWLGCGEQNVWSEKGNQIAQYEAQCFARNFSIAQMRDVLTIFTRSDLSADVAKLTVPVAIFAGLSGRLGAEAAKDSIAAFRTLCPHADLITVPEVGGTYCMIEDPEATAQLAVPWLKG